MEFINLDTGKIFTNGYPYVLWIGDQCGVGAVYNKTICFISNHKLINIQINSPVFSLLDVKKILNKESINGFEYVNLNDMKTTHINSTGIQYNDIYIHTIYISAYYDTPGEYLDDVIIGDEILRVGIDLYDDNESLYINMSNMGINIPNQIQKAIFPSNVHNDKDDKILLNRKWKELLSNYWDIVANKGSYKSLINSLKWFEWGNLLELRELWKYSDIDSKVKYKETELKKFISDLYSAEMSRFAKSTYYSISLALQELEGMDEHFNPIPIQKMIPKWSKEDIALKLSMLGSFFETYFLPIHLDIIKCTIEDIVFTTPIKLSTSTSITNTYYQTTNEFVKCNINDGDIFILSNTSSQVNSSTEFNTGIQPGAFSDSEDIDTYIMGIDDTIGIIKDDEDLKLFMSQLFTGVGVNINIKFDIPIQSDDFIQKENLFMKIDKTNEWINRENYKILKPINNIATFEFNILCREEAEYDLRIDFITGTGKIINKQVKFKVIDDSEINIGIFKIKNQSPTLDDWFGNMVADYNISRTPIKDTDNISIMQYIPVDNNDTGARRNNVLIFLSTEKYRTDYFDENHEFLRENYFITHNDKKTYKSNGEIDSREQYTICVSKQFDFDPMEWLNTAEDTPKSYLYKNTYEYFPEFHYLEELSGSTLEDYTAYDNDALCVVPFIGGDRNNTLKYGKNISDTEWVFENITTGEVQRITNSIREPYITNKNFKNYLTYGYYNVKFRYRLGNEDKEIILNSAFRKLPGVKN